MLNSYYFQNLQTNHKQSQILLLRKRIIVIVKEEISGFKEKTNKKYIYFNSYSGVFHLRGDKDDLNLLKELGIGVRRNSGFGSIDLI